MVKNAEESAAKKNTISDIAKELNLSKSTISRAISGKGRISEATRQRVLSYIQENEYKPNVMEKGILQSKTFNIGVVLPSDSNSVDKPFFQKCLMGICEVAASHDYNVVVTTISEQDITLLQRIVNSRKVDGIVLTRTLVDDRPIKYLKSKSIPFVTIGTSDDAGVVQIDNDHRGGCKELTNYLLMSGVQSMGLLIGDKNHIVNQLRYLGFKEGVEINNKLVDEALVFFDANTKAFIDRAVETLMEKKVDCIICSDDFICSRVLSKLTMDGYDVPIDVKVASFYNSPFLESHMPPITTLDFDVHELGDIAGQRLIELIRGKSPMLKTLLDYKVVLKTSTK